MDTKRYAEGGVIPAGGVDKHPALYGRAISLAADAEQRFLKLNEENRAMREELRQAHLDTYVHPAAVEACAKEELVAQLFGCGCDEVAQAVHLLVEVRRSLD